MSGSIILPASTGARWCFAHHGRIFVRFRLAAHFAAIQRLLPLWNKPAPPASPVPLHQPQPLAATGAAWPGALDHRCGVQVRRYARPRPRPACPLGAVAPRRHPRCDAQTVWGGRSALCWRADPNAFVDHAQRKADGVPRSTASPAVLHSGNPSSSRRTLKPCARSAATASKDSTHHGPRQ